MTWRFVVVDLFKLCQHKASLATCATIGMGCATIGMGCATIGMGCATMRRRYVDVVTLGSG